MSQLISLKGSIPAGNVGVPSDKSISHRALMLSSLAVGRSHISDLLESDDTTATVEALRQMGATLSRIGVNQWQVDGVGLGGLLEPTDKIHLGNSGTSARLLMGLIASHGISVTMVGDHSLQKRPMARIITPLEKIGATFKGHHGDKLPLTIVGSTTPAPIQYTSPIASAQLKSAILLAGLNTPGVTTVVEPIPTRDHTERMLKSMGAKIETQAMEDGSAVIRLWGQPELNPHTISVPGDISSAAFPITLAAMTLGAEITLPNIGVNPLRTGVLDALKAMGAHITLENKRIVANEPVADINVKGATLKGLTNLGVEPSRMIDEFPILFVAAAMANGTTRLHGLQELRVKESDRLAVMAKGLKDNGVDVTLFEDGIEIIGTGGHVNGGGIINSHLDHRIAMSFAVLGQAAQNPITINDAEVINTSFPKFVKTMTAIGCRFA